MHHLENLRFSRISEEEVHYKDIQINFLNASFQDNIFQCEAAVKKQVQWDESTKYQNVTAANSSQYQQERKSQSTLSNTTQSNHKWVSLKEFWGIVQVRNQIYQKYNELELQYKILLNNSPLISKQLQCQRKKNTYLKQVIQNHEKRSEQMIEYVESTANQKIRQFRSMIMLQMMNQIDKFRYQAFKLQEEEEEETQQKQVKQMTQQSEYDDILELFQ